MWAGFNVNNEDKKKQMQQQQQFQGLFDNI